MIQLFEQIDKGQKEGNCLYLTESTLNLEWKCPGRRPPTPSDDSDMDDEYEDDDVDLQDSDGDAGIVATPARSKLIMSSANKELRGSARKKTTDLSSILSNMKRHKRLGEIEQNKEAAAAAQANSDTPEEGSVAGAINSIMSDSNDSIS